MSRPSAAWFRATWPANRGALIFIASGLVFAATDSLTKVLVADAPVVDVVWGRYVAYLGAIVLFAGRRNPVGFLLTSRLPAQLARGVSMFVATATFFWALSLLPFAEVSTLVSVSPLIVILLAGPLLGERLALASGLGALVGFIGVVAMIGLEPGHLNLAVLVPLATAASFGIFSLLTRALRGEQADVTLFYSGLVGLFAATVVLVLLPTASSPQTWQWAGIGCVGITALAGHRLLVAAYRWGRASDLAPLGYLGLLWSFAIGAVVFGEPVHPQAILGALAIAVGGIIVLRSTQLDEDMVPQVLIDYGDSIAEPTVHSSRPSE